MVSGSPAQASRSELPFPPLACSSTWSLPLLGSCSPPERPLLLCGVKLSNGWCISLLRAARLVCRCRCSTSEAPGGWLPVWDPPPDPLLWLPFPFDGRPSDDSEALRPASASSSSSAGVAASCASRCSLTNGDPSSEKRYVVVLSQFCSIFTHCMSFCRVPEAQHLHAEQGLFASRRHAGPTMPTKY